MIAFPCSSFFHFSLLFPLSNMSKTASASEKPNLFEFFRAPKVFEQSSKIAQAENRVLARAVRTRSQIAERERFIQYKAKARFWLC
ncbi:hypothetical protein IKQ19_20265 [Candidatus Saccharibacteria bacterium]|nr:hypothetical protein [Candidatus Saccharibacteria bacterium]